MTQFVIVFVCFLFQFLMGNSGHFSLRGQQKQRVIVALLSLTKPQTFVLSLLLLIYARMRFFVCVCVCVCFLCVFICLLLLFFVFVFSMPLMSQSGHSRSAQSLGVSSSPPKSQTPSLPPQWGVKALIHEQFRPFGSGRPSEPAQCQMMMMS